MNTTFWMKDIHSDPGPVKRVWQLKGFAPKIAAAVVLQEIDYDFVIRLLRNQPTDMKEVESSSSTKTCKRCKSSFALDSNSTSACRFHPTYFVSRRHDDQKRYYDLGPDDPPYAAKFWDCCGSEDPQAQGCKTSFHVSYDD